MLEPVQDTLLALLDGLERAAPAGDQRVLQDRRAYEIEILFFFNETQAIRRGTCGVFVLRRAWSTHRIDALLDLLAENEVDLAGDAVLGDDRLTAFLELGNLFLGPLDVVMVVAVAPGLLERVGGRFFPVVDVGEAGLEIGGLDLYDVDLDCYRFDGDAGVRHL